MPSKYDARSGTAAARYESALHKLRIISTAALVLGIIAIFVSMSVLVLGQQAQPVVNQTKTSFGSTLAGIDQPLNASSLSVINDAQNSYFETAGEMYLNHSLANPVYPSIAQNVNTFVVGGKPSVIYLGSITCIWCGENRWAMALALSRFGNFSNLYAGYSSLGDGDVPTLYWTPDQLNVSSDAIGNYYSSRYLNFISIEDLNPIRGGFLINSGSAILSNLERLGNQTYIRAFGLIVNLSANNQSTAFKGTPYTIWGGYQFGGADAEAFGNTTPSGSTIPLTYMTHGQVLAQLSNPNDQFAWTEYAGADVYIAAMCKTLNNTPNVSACQLPAIRGIEAQIK